MPVYEPEVEIIDEHGALWRRREKKTARCITPEEIADMEAFLAWDESRMVTGQTFVVDAGTLL
jgi:NAD(P)-dependent dehydrogenase (short-subunit alcohol dehydrogenase family)